MAEQPAHGMVVTAEGAVFDDEFTLDIRVVDAVPPTSMLLSTSDNCGHTCEKDTCISHTADPW